jgi:hypothetical protein
MNARPRARTDGLVTEQVGDDLVVYDEATQTAHALAPQAASVWKHCDGASTLEEIARSLAIDEAQVADAPEQLHVAGLLERPHLVTRRQASKGIAAAGAAAFGAPLIYSVAVRPASAAASQPPVCVPTGPGPGRAARHPSLLLPVHTRRGANMKTPYFTAISGRGVRIT